VYCTCPLKEVIGERGSKTQYLGIDWASQYQRTKRDEILAREMAAVVVITTTAGPGQCVFAAAASSYLLAAGSPAWLAAYHQSELGRSVLYG
jgi:hypothetical protein